MLTRLLGQFLRRKRDAAGLREKALASFRVGHYDDAEWRFRELALREPDSVAAWSNLAVTLIRQRRFDACLVALHHVAELDPTSVGVHVELGNICTRLGRQREAIDHLRHALVLAPHSAEASRSLIMALTEACDWSGVREWLQGFARLQQVAPPEVWAAHLPPTVCLGLPFSAAFQRALAEALALRLLSSAGFGSIRLNQRRTEGGERIRIGYLSSDFRNHPVAHLSSRLYGLHDRARFEVFAYSLGPDDGSDYRQRIREDCDHFVDLAGRTSPDISRRIVQDHIDILVDLMGYTANAATEVFARRSAPIQVNFLGYAGTMGADFMDYIIVDSVVAPSGSEAWFAERPVRLPGSYLINDDAQPIHERTPSRGECSLPEEGFVYCCFNKNQKIEPEIFDAWMRILRAVPDSVLWLSHSGDLCSENLRLEAERRGVPGARLVFARKLAAKPEHLARHRVADLFLDTHYFNAHTTACDALWAGLPVLTWPGDTFASRVAASLLHAVGLPELVATSLDQYVENAVDLASEPDRLGALRRRLADQRSCSALFAPADYARKLERAYLEMWRLHMSGLAPRAIDAG
jgi:predicted O-linked N-acetylglucosamine transferase (SPINDLY family)